MRGEMSDQRLHRLFSRARLDDRQVNELLGIARGLIADGVVTNDEAEYLLKWLAANREVTDNPVIRLLYERIDQILSDGVLKDDEAADLLEALTQFTGGDFELGEALKSSGLPLCDPPPDVSFSGRRFCFTGTFAFGSRNDCEKAVMQHGGAVGSLTRQTQFLVIGAYATESWIHSTYGRKIERAVEMRENGHPIAIIAESHWAGHLVA